MKHNHPGAAPEQDVSSSNGELAVSRTQDNLEEDALNIDESTNAEEIPRDNSRCSDVEAVRKVLSYQFNDVLVIDEKLALPTIAPQESTVAGEDELPIA